MRRAVERHPAPAGAGRRPDLRLAVFAGILVPRGPAEEAWMINEEDFSSVAEVSPEMAFVRLERKFRHVLEQNLEGSQNNMTHRNYIAEYINHTIAAAEALELPIFATLPDFREMGRDQAEEYDRVIALVDRFAVKTQIAYIRKPPRNSVALESSEKLILRHYVEQIKLIIDQSTLVVAKKERLYNKLNDFLAELDRDRTQLQAFSDLVIGLAHTAGDAAQELEPAWKWVKLIGTLIGGRQENEQIGLPKPPTPKRLEPPKTRLPPKAPDIDDEIPF
jgi:hypothetical protein